MIAKCTFFFLIYLASNAQYFSFSAFSAKKNLFPKTRPTNRISDKTHQNKITLKLSYDRNNHMWVLSCSNSQISYNICKKDRMWMIWETQNMFSSSLYVTQKSSSTQTIVFIHPAYWDIQIFFLFFSLQQYLILQKNITSVTNTY